MNHGKSICEHLKGIRRMIAEEYGIPLEQEECNFEGDCKGTCPRCEEELQYLEREIMKRKLEGEDMSFEGIAERYLKEIFVDPSAKPTSSKPPFEHYISTGMFCPDLFDEEDE